MSDCNWCNSSDHIWRPNRREFLYVGVIGSFGLTLGNYFKLHAESAAGKVAASDAKTKAVINIYLPGGMAAQVISPFEVTASFKAKDPIAKVIVTDAAGRHEVAVDQARD